MFLRRSPARMLGYTRKMTYVTPPKMRRERTTAAIVPKTRR